MELALVVVSLALVYAHWKLAKLDGLLRANYVALKRLNSAIERFEDLEASRIFGVNAEIQTRSFEDR